MVKPSLADALYWLEKMVDGAEGHLSENGSAAPYWMDGHIEAAREFLDKAGVARRG